ncbi:putative PEP-binding protein [Nocardioides sp. B-3]|uniref:putative PEP-binding protein n=1 Tax=Nocardioides sp. B-3 TaxID=2895565 RepID=UPI003FA588F3
MDRGVFRRSPFESIDVAGVGRLVSMASAAGRASRPGLKMGACGEHAGDPDSIQFFDEIGLDYVSCSPFRVPIAGLEAGRSTLRLAVSSSA